MSLIIIIILKFTLVGFGHYTDAMDTDVGLNGSSSGTTEVGTTDALGSGDATSASDGATIKAGTSAGLPVTKEENS